MTSPHGWATTSKTRHLRNSPPFHPEFIHGFITASLLSLAALTILHLDHKRRTRELRKHLDNALRQLITLESAVRDYRIEHISPIRYVSATITARQKLFKLI